MIICFWEGKSMIKKLRKNEKGFTLAELLIVVAIIGVLVAISIPIFTAQLEKAREATDKANIRNAYAIASAAALTEEEWTTATPTKDNTFTEYTYTPGKNGGDDSTWAITVKATQKSTTNGTDGWADGKPNIGGISVDASTVSYTVTIKGDGTCTISSAK